MKITKEQLINTAKELNEILFVENDPQAINFTAPLETVRTSIKEAAALLTAQDDLTIGTKQVLAELGVWIEDEDLPGQSDEAEMTDVQDVSEIPPEPEPVKTTPVAPKQTIAGKMITTPAGPKTPNKVPTPQDLVMAASNRQELVDLLNAYTDLKPLRTTHRSYKVDADLQAAMCILLNGGVIAPVKSTPEKAQAKPDVKPTAKVKNDTTPKNNGTQSDSGKWVRADRVGAICTVLQQNTPTSFEDLVAQAEKVIIAAGGKSIPIDTAYVAKFVIKTLKCYNIPVSF